MQKNNFIMQKKQFKNLFMRPNFHFLLLVGTLMLFSLTALGQDSRHEIRTGFGVGDEPHLHSVQHSYVRDYHLEPGTGDIGVSTQCLSWIVYLEYFCHLGKRWAVGVSVGGGIGWEAAHVPEVYPNITVDMKSRSYFAMPVVKYTWYGHNRFRLYSKAGLGARYYRLDVTCDTQSFPEIHEKNVKLSYQLSVAGVEVGGERMRGFVELGYGMQGIFNFGILLNL